MSWNLQLTGPAQKDLRKLPARDKARIKAALTAMQQDPLNGDLVRLKGQSTAWRRRVGNYRIFFDVYPEQLLIVIAGINRRTSTTY